LIRASILAAANPVLGRYDKSKSLKFNVDISAPIMSRFDLFYVVLDEKNDVLDLHRMGDCAVTPDFTTEDLQTYIKFCRSLKPKFTREAAAVLRTEYKKLRQADKTGQKTAYRITVRQLESLVRLSEALAKLHCDEWINETYVKEATRLLQMSIITIEQNDVEIDDIMQRDLNEIQKRRKDQLMEDVVILLF
jgi:DNA replication licensing factor MCM6